jgi:hypothetical protein
MWEGYQPNGSAAVNQGIVRTLFIFLKVNSFMVLFFKFHDPKLMGYCAQWQPHSPTLSNRVRDKSVDISQY